MAFRPLRSYSSEFPQAYWLKLPEPFRDPRDRRFQFRKTFELKEVPAHAELHVTADAKYCLYINGEFVHFGPARGFQSHWPFDRIDAAPYLRPGRNVIAALLYTFGIGNYTYSCAGEYGFLLSGSAGDVDLSTNETWKGRIAPGYLFAVARGSGQYGFQEFFDFRKAQDDWFQPDYDDSAWTDDLAPHMRIAGSMPWHRFEERNLPLLTKFVIPAKTRCSVSCHQPAADGWQPVRHIYYSYHADRFLWKDAPESGDTAVFRDGIAGQTVDFGEEVTGTLRFEIDHAAEGMVLDYFTFECLKDGRPDIPEKETHPLTLYGGRLILRAGRNELELSLPWGFRYVALWIHGAGNGLSVKLSARVLRYPFDLRGQFASSDPVFSDIWRMCVHTQQCCSVDSYIDCPWRENAQWWGDALVQSQNTFRLAADDRLLVRGLRLIGEQRTPNGLTYAMAPTVGHTCVLPDYSAMYLVTLWAHWFQTGSTALYEELAGSVDSILDYFRTEADLNGGLAPYDSRYWLFLDWCSALFKQGTPALLNLIWLWGMKQVRIVAEAAGDRTRAARLDSEIEKLSGVIIAKLYDPETRLLYDGLLPDGTPVKTHSPHAAALGIILDLLPEAHEVWVEQILLPLVRSSREKNPLQPSSYFMHYIFQALKIKGYRRDVADCIRRWWGEFVQAGCSTAPELFLEHSTPGATSFCHAWSAHPILHLSEILLGVRQLEPGWTRISFEPLLIPGLDVSGVVPTPLGDIRVSVVWHDGRAETRCEAPDGMICEQGTRESR